MEKYDLVIIGSGLMGSVIAHESIKNKLKVLVIEKRNHIGGNCYTENINNINVHKYGAHIFHTDNLKVWNYINQFAKFNNFINSPIAIYKNKMYNLPFNLNTYYNLYNEYKINKIKNIINKKTNKYKNIIPNNLEEQAIKLVGYDIYEILIKGYTEKQWGRKCNELPAEIIKRLPVRMTFNNNYFNDKYQGIPIGGYTQIFEKLLKNAKVILNVNYKNIINKINFNAMVYTGKIDEYYDYKFGELEYRSLIFKNKLLKIPNFQGNAVVNYTDIKIPYTRIIEHKHFENLNTNNTYISYEYSTEYNKNKNIDPYYPIGLDKNINIYNKYVEHSKKDKNIFFLGRLAEYKYYDMDDIIEKALVSFKKIYKKIKK